MKEKYKCFCDKISDNDYNEYDLEGACDLLNQQYEEIKQLKQSQKQLAISELEKVKELGFMESYTLDVPNILILQYRDFNKLMDDQLKTLKGE